MAKVGNLIWDDEERTYATGMIQTRTLKLVVELIPTFDPNNLSSKPINSSEPAFTVVEKTENGSCEVGVAWCKQVDSAGKRSHGMEYLSLSLDDPSFPSTLPLTAWTLDGKPLEMDVKWQRPKARVAA